MFMKSVENKKMIQVDIRSQTQTQNNRLENVLSVLDVTVWSDLDQKTSDWYWSATLVS